MNCTPARVGRSGVGGDRKSDDGGTLVAGADAICITQPQPEYWARGILEFTVFSIPKMVLKLKSENDC